VHARLPLGELTLTVTLSPGGPCLLCQPRRRQACTRAAEMSRLRAWAASTALCRLLSLRPALAPGQMQLFGSRARLMPWRPRASRARRRSCHMLLANLRPPGQTAYVIPRGYAFDYVTCANYMFEIWGWLAFAFATRTLTAFMFIAAGAFQMAVWARAKHARLRRVLYPNLPPSCAVGE